ncbi:MAG: DUF3363 domain-containing protein, partial [Acidithiobacillus sp.]|nr:DUF3363 domain-containing protein [Acidithiobacillus sp.]
MRPLSSTETIEDRIKKIKEKELEREAQGWTSRGRAQASRVANKVERARGGGGGKALRDMIKALLPRTSNQATAKPTSKGPAVRQAARRCTVKVQYAKNRKPGQWMAHGRYLEREGAQKEGEKGLGFDVFSDEVPVHETLNNWQMDGDPKVFKVILAPEDALSPEALKEFTRKFNKKIQNQLGNEYDWVAVDHHNTSHPHVHLMIRGKADLELSPDMIRRGMREAASEILTESLGYKTQKEIQKAKELEIGARQFTGIDREIQSRATPALQGYAVITEPVDLQNREARRLRMARLEILTQVGVADKIGPMTWRLEPGWDKALKELQILQTRTKMVAESRALMTEPRCLPQVTRLQEGDRLVGRVLGTGLDDNTGRSYILLEGVDNRAHIVYQTASIEKQRAAGNLKLRSLVALEHLGKGVAVKEYDVTIPDNAWKKSKIPDQALDDDEAWRQKHNKPEPELPTTGFAAYWHQKRLERRELLKKQAELEKQAE